MFRAASVASTVKVMAAWANAETAVNKRRMAMGNMRFGFMDLLNQEQRAATRRHPKLGQIPRALCLLVAYLDFNVSKTISGVTAKRTGTILVPMPVVTNR